MRRHPIHLPLFLVLAIGFLATASASAAETIAKGEEFSVTVGNIGSQYNTYWFSDQDGYLGSGHTLTTSSLSVGNHVLYADVYLASTDEFVWQGSLAVKVTAPGSASAISAGNGEITAPGEFEDVSHFLLGCPDIYQVSDVYPKMVKAVSAVVNVKIYVDNQYALYDLIDLFQQKGVSDSEWDYALAPVDTIWMRDYGPLYVQNGNQLEVIDIQYYPGRDADNDIPLVVAQEFDQAVYDLPIYWEGGNYTSDGKGRIFSSTVIYDYNYGTKSQIRSEIEEAFNADLTTMSPMLNDGGTGHLDMFALWTSSGKLFLNKFPIGHPNYARMNSHKTKLTNLGYQTKRLALADSAYSSHTNGVLINGIALVPTYKNATTDSAALQAYQNAGYDTVGIDCTRIIQWAGAIHCISITIPKKQ